MNIITSSTPLLHHDLGGRDERQDLPPPRPASAAASEREERDVARKRGKRRGRGLHTQSSEGRRRRRKADRAVYYTSFKYTTLFITVNFLSYNPEPIPPLVTISITPSSSRCLPCTPGLSPGTSTGTGEEERGR